MLVINANQEQKRVFNKLIQELNAQVVWSGRFIIMGDRLILEGFVRSLFLYFDIQKAEVQFADLPADEEEEIKISDHPELIDLISMAVYAFGKWGIWKDSASDKDEKQLDQIFAEILGAYDLESAFSEERCEFYQSGRLITYEDVIETVLKFTGVKILSPMLKLPAAEQQDDTSADESGQGSTDLFRKNSASAGNKADNNTASKEAENSQKTERIEKYHARIGVLDRLSEMQRKALERDIRNDKLLNEEEKEELFFPIRDYERMQKMSAEQSAAGGFAAREKAAAERIEKYHARIGVLDRLSELQRKTLERDIRNDKLLTEAEKEELFYPIRDYEQSLDQAHTAQTTSETEKSILGNPRTGAASAAARDETAAAERIDKYFARIKVLDRLSELQKKTLTRDIRNDRLLNANEKDKLIYLVQDFEYHVKLIEIEEALKVKENRTYSFIKKLIKKIEQEDLFEKTKQDLQAKLYELRDQTGSREMQAIMEKVPMHVERAEYQELMEKLKPYEDLGFGAYKERLRQMRETLEIKEISNMLMQFQKKAQKKDRKEYVKLLQSIEEKDFAEENAAPYVEQILDWIGELDEARLKKLISNAKSMDFDTAASVYETIRRESFLPKLRESALAVVSRRLDEISLSECRLLVLALEKTMTGVIRKNPRHYFYPVEKILTNTVKPEDVRLINSAVSAYAEKRGRFEHPLLMVDISKEGNGRDGMLLTSEHIFYSTRLNGYQIPISAIKSIYVSSGLLKNKVVTAEEMNGVKHKLPYAVEAEETQNWAKVLDSFVKYLQGRNVSDRLSYESLEDEGAVCCGRCGCIYHDFDVCPECGYKKNA